MKKIIFTCFILISIYSCSKVSKVTVIETFDKEISSVIHPKKDGSYTTYYVEIQGEVNDSIKIEYFDDSFSFYYFGKINEFKRMDYYGGISEKLTFYPYKATSGKLTIKQVLQ
ncbi:hypothetical protein C8N46_106106 [Kordia periserrulae]|uniref:Uncharacterized protein n=1 Tax=Kordia periserrulae TaxID=701523 RepID=A0A2T6BWK6_9FLAO|nr:hypothetical protein [Kordia periserrulae]PTX60462.1 hypothetical protein C8N46_106106 [Kordia periserrulae]